MHKDLDEVDDSVAHQHVVPQPIEHLIALLQNEKVMTRRLRQDSDEMKEEILRLERSCKDEEKAMTKTSSELQQSDTERRHLMQQLEISQNQLVELRMEYDMLQRESLFLQHEENNHSSEAQFLQRLLEEYQRDSKVIEESIGLLEDATFGLEGQSRALQQATANLEQQVSLESAGLEKDQLELQAVRQAVESMAAGRAGTALGFDSELRDDPAGFQRTGGLGQRHWSAGMSLFGQKSFSFGRTGQTGPVRDGV